MSTTATFTDLTSSNGSTERREAVRLLNVAGYYVFVISNQSGLHAAYYDEVAVKSFHSHMQKELAAHGAHIDAFYFCPHHPDGVVKSLAVSCRCRKARTGHAGAGSARMVDRCSARAS